MMTSEEHYEGRRAMRMDVQGRTRGRPEENGCYMHFSMSC